MTRVSLCRLLIYTSMYMFPTAFVHEVKYVHPTYCIYSVYMTCVSLDLVHQIMSANCDKLLFIVY